MPRPPLHLEPEAGWPLGWGPALKDFQVHLRLERGLSPRTAEAYLSDLKQFALWACDRVVSPKTLNKDHVTDFILSQQGEGKATRSLARLASSLRTFLAFGLAEEATQVGPEAVVRATRPPRLLPKTLSEAQIIDLLQAPKVDSPKGVRDRAWLELLYASGLRVSELSELPALSVFLDEGFLKVMGKGRKERLIPFGENAEHWLRRWLALRGGFRPRSDALFVGRGGKP